MLFRSLTVNDPDQAETPPTQITPPQKVPSNQLPADAPSADEPSADEDSITPPTQSGADTNSGNNGSAKAATALDTSHITLTDANNLVYNGEAKKPSVTVSFDNGTTSVNPAEYTVTYSNNTNASTDSAKAIVTVKAAAGSTVCSGEATKTFEIAKAELTDSNINLGSTTNLV